MTTPSIAEKRLRMSAGNHGRMAFGSRSSGEAGAQAALPAGGRGSRLLEIAVTTCLLAARTAAADQGPPGSVTANNEGELAEVTVTAQRRTENLQDVPIAIQAITAVTLQQLSIENFDDVVKYLPNVTVAGTGPGQNNIYMRGLSIGPATLQGGGAVGDFPNVAVYLDDQSAQLPGRNLDVYAADLERIEVLEGPQGTLFGAGAEAGVVRYITNKPKLDVTEGNVDAGYGTTAHGDPSSNVDAAINLPLIAERLAVRAVIYSDTRGGYINNVPGKFVRQSTDVGIHYAGYINNVPGPPTPINSASNNNLVANAINPVTYDGIRTGALLKFNEDWNALFVQSYQNMDAQGVFYETPQGSGIPAPHLPDLSVQLYNPSFDKDRFENTALTVNGRVGELNFVYSGAYLVRNVSQVQDYTNYARGTYADYYQCIPGPKGTPGQCYSPATTWHDQERDVHQSHEMRLSTPDDWRVRAIGGVFWENYVIHEQTDWLYKTAPGFTDIGPPPGASVNNPDIRNDNEAFFDDVTRGYKQRAAFGSVDVRPDTEGADIDGGYSLLSVRQHGGRSLRRELWLLRGRSATLSRQCLEFECIGPPEHLYGDPEPGQSHVEDHARSDGLLHMVARLSARRLQSQYALQRAAGFSDPARVCTRHANQQRIRLEDGMAGSPVAIQRCGIPRRLEARSGHFLRSE